MTKSKYLQAASLAFICSMALPAQACLTSESGSNDTESNASTGLCSNTSIDGNLNKNDTIDWFAFDVSEAGTIDISLNHHRRDDYDWD